MAPQTTQILLKVFEKHRFAIRARLVVKFIRSHFQQSVKKLIVEMLRQICSINNGTNSQTWRDIGKKVLSVFMCFIYTDKRFLIITLAY